MHTQSAPKDATAGREVAEAVVEVYEEYEEALNGLEGFSHPFILGCFHRLRQEQIGSLKVRPRVFLKYGLRLEELPVLGVFPLDSPTRPNPIGLHWSD